jgi:enoyl-CoA hydratase/carnithine racemase
MSLYQNWVVREEENVVTLVLNRPESTNSLTTGCLLELKEISSWLDSEAGVRAVVVEGSGKHFSSGMDPGEFRADLDLSLEQLQAAIREHLDCLRVFEVLGKPTIAKIRGFCLGGGLMLALCCDFRIASLRSVFSLPEIKIGFPIMWGTHRVTRVAGLARAKEMILLGGKHKAKELEEWNLVHKAVPEEDLEPAIAGLLRKLDEIPVHSYRVTKRIIQFSQEKPALESEEAEVWSLTELMQGMDLRGAVQAYLDARKLG